VTRIKAVNAMSGFAFSAEAASYALALGHFSGEERRSAPPPIGSQM
jgi:hypothetical protein